MIKRFFNWLFKRKKKTLIVKGDWVELFKPGLRKAFIKAHKEVYPEEDYLGLEEAYRDLDEGDRR